MIGEQRASRRYKSFKYTLVLGVIRTGGVRWC